MSHLISGSAFGTTQTSKFLIDAGGRQRVSQITTLGDYKHLGGANQLLMNSVQVGTGTGALTASVPGFTMTTSATNDVSIHQTKQFHVYESGKSQVVEETMMRFELQTNVIKRVGYFSTSTASPYSANRDGFWLESNGVLGDYYFVVEKDGVETVRVIRGDWDDPLNGTGESGIDADWFNFNVITFDFLWLGGTDFSFYYKYNNYFYLANRYSHAGNALSPAILSPSQPVRYEMEQSGAGSGVLIMVCATVGTEGSLNSLGVDHEVGTSLARIQANSASAIYAIVGYRLQSTRRDAVTRIDSAEMAELSGPNNNYMWEIRLNPVVAGTFAYSDFPNSGIQVAIGDTAGSPSTNTVTGGIVLHRGYGSDAIPVSIPINLALAAGSTIDGVSDTIVLCVQPDSANQDIVGNMSIFEHL